MNFKCKMCSLIKQEKEFYKRNDSVGKCVYQPCIICRKTYWNKYGLKNRLLSGTARKKWTTDAAKARNKRYKEKNKERLKPAWIAHKNVQRALKKGILIRPDRCSSCLVVCKPDAAHYDYKKVLDIRWLCRKCHCKWDDIEPKTARVLLKGAWTS